MENKKVLHVRSAEAVRGKSRVGIPRLKTNKWYVKLRYKDWTGKVKEIQ